MSRFCYQGGLSAHQLRLLRPVPPFETDNPCFDVVHVSRRPPVSYTAVSYTWGDEQPCETVFLDRKPFAVRRNLWTLLHYLRIFSQTAPWTYLWVDAICIDQSDSRERNAQVSLMHQTYGDALSVSVWLGLPKTPARWPSSVPIKTFDSEHGVDWQNSMKFLANRAYWNRRWVIQEFLLAKDVQIYCGNSCTTFWNFRSELCDMIDMDSLESDSSKWRRDAKSSQFAALPLLMNRQADKHPELSRPLHELLIDHREAKCTDPRDRVFSLLSLTTPNEQRLLRRLLPDYSLSEDQVIIFALAHLLHFTRLMDFDLLNGPESKHIFQALGLSGQQRSRLVGQATWYDYFESDCHELRRTLAAHGSDLASYS